MRTKTIKDAKLYNENDNYYLDITYIVEDNYSVIETRCPKVRLPIEFGSIESRIVASLMPIRDEYEHLLCIDGGYLKLEEKNGVCFYTKTIKEKPQKMTVEEIEKKLGYKVEIVAKKEA